MKNLYQPGVAAELAARIRSLRADARPLWGTMTPAQAMSHTAAGMEMAVGDAKHPRMFIGSLIGRLIKPLALRDDEPMRRNSPTVPALVRTGDHDLAAEQERLVALVERFVNGGPSAAATHPHAFFGRLTADEWAVLMYKHIDHHLRQFGA